MSQTIKNKLVMTFSAEQGDNVNVTLYDQKSDLASDTVAEAMMEIVGMEVLMNDDGFLMDSAYAAKTVQEIENILF